MAARQRGHRGGDGGDVHVAVGCPVGQRRDVPGGRDEPGSTATSNSAALTVISNGVPTATITEPAADGDSRYSAGDTIDYAGTGTDPEDGDAPGAARSPGASIFTMTRISIRSSPIRRGTSGSFIIPTLGETSANVWYRIHLTVSDSSGLTSSTYRDVLPNTVNLGFETNPPGLQVRLDGPPLATPASIESVVGLQRTIGVVSPQTLDNQTYVFSSWAHGGPATQDIQTPARRYHVHRKLRTRRCRVDLQRFIRPEGFSGRRKRMAGIERRSLDLRGTSSGARQPGTSSRWPIVPSLSSADQTVAASFATLNSNSSPRFGVVLRYQDPQNYYLVSRLGGGTSVLQISKVVNGIVTVLKSMALPNPVSNTFFRLEGQANGTTLTLRLDGVQKLSVEDSTFSAGNIGIGLGSMSTTTAQTVRANDFAASAP